MMMMHSGLDDTTKLRMLQAKALSKEARGGEYRYIELTHEYNRWKCRCTNVDLHIASTTCVCIFVLKLLQSVITTMPVRYNRDKHQSVLVHMQCGTPKSQECMCVVEILQTFQQGPSQLHCLFSNAVCQLGFEIESP